MKSSGRFQPGDVVVGDWVWGVGAWLVHPVIRVNRHTITVGIHRVHGGWLTTETLRWDDIHGLIPAVSDAPIDAVQDLADAAMRVRGGLLDLDQRAAVAALLLIAGSARLPTPVTAALFNAITELARPPRDEPIHPSKNSRNGRDGQTGDTDESRQEGES